MTIQECEEQFNRAIVDAIKRDVPEALDADGNIKPEVIEGMRKRCERK